MTSTIQQRLTRITQQAQEAASATLHAFEQKIIASSNYVNINIGSPHCMYVAGCSAFNSMVNHAVCLFCNVTECPILPPNCH
jgi:hypothetical protein